MFLLATPFVYAYIATHHHQQQHPAPPQADRDNRGGEFAEAYTASPLAAENLEVTQQLSTKQSLLDAESQKALQVTRATTTPSWWALWVLFRYRTLRDWANPAYLMPRLSDKIIFCFIIFTMYVLLFFVVLLVATHWLVYSKVCMSTPLIITHH